MQINYITAAGMSQDGFLNILAMLHIRNYYAYVTRGHIDYDPLLKIVNIRLPHLIISRNTYA